MCPILLRLRYRAIQSTNGKIQHTWLISVRLAECCAWQKPWKRMQTSRMRTARLLTVSQHALCMGVCIQACTGQGGVSPGGVCPGRYLPRRVSAQRGVCPGGICPGGVSAGEKGIVARGRCVADTPSSPADTCPGQTLAGQIPPWADTLWTEWQTGVKTLPCRNYVAGGNECNNVSILMNGTNCFSKRIKFGCPSFKIRNWKSFLWGHLYHDTYSLTFL